MIKLKPIAENILQEADEKVTWGDVRRFFNEMLEAQRSSGTKKIAADVGKTALKKAGLAGAKWAANLLTGGTAGVVLDLVADAVADAADATSGTLNPASIGKALLNIGKEVTNKELKNPKGSEFKSMTGPFWEAIKISSELSILLDDKVEKMFIDQIILPKLQDAGAESEELPNMDEELGKWLNSMGLKDKADVHFKGVSGDL
jgi:hypothetical protein